MNTGKWYGHFLIMAVALVQKDQLGMNTATECSFLAVGT